MDMRANATHPSLVKVKQVCGGCNNGWMSVLEDQAKPVLRDVADLNRDTLTLDELRLLALWAAKTAAMYEFNDVQTRVFSPAQLRDLYVLRKVPRQTQVFIGRYHGEHGSRLRHHHNWVHSRLSDGRHGERVGATGETGIALGRAAFLVRTVSPAKLGPIDTFYPSEHADTWHGIWPQVPDGLTLSGPIMDDDGFTAAVTSMSSGTVKLL